MMVRDSLTLFALLLAAGALYVITSFLFRSFASYRADLAKQYAATGRESLRGGRAKDAVAALRASLAYDPDNAGNRLLYAEALADTNQLNQATSYFLSLREAQPADGFINLQLARLARKKGDTDQSIQYYRAATLGNWNGDALTERRDARMELVDYLIQKGDLGSARSEILIAATNARETPNLDILFGDRLLQASDPSDALVFYRKAAKLDPHSFEALYKAGSVAYSQGSFNEAARLLSLALKEPQARKHEDSHVAQVASLEANARRILALSPAATLPPHQRVEHLQLAAPIAEARLNACMTQVGAAASSNTTLQALKARWQAATPVLSKHITPDDTGSQDALTQLIFDTEVHTSPICGPPSGDDALLLLLAQSAAERQ